MVFSLAIIQVYLYTLCIFAELIHTPNENQDYTGCFYFNYCLLICIYDTIVQNYHEQ
jgi:hypothetical protein